VPRDFAAIAGAPDEAGGRALIRVLAAHAISAELRDAGCGFVDVVVPRDLREEARRLLKAHLVALARDEEPEVIAVAPDPASGFALAGALRAAGFPVTTSQRAVHASRQSTGILVPHAVVAAAREFMAPLEAQAADVEPLQDEPEGEHEETAPIAERASADLAAIDGERGTASVGGSVVSGAEDAGADAAALAPGEGAEQADEVESADDTATVDEGPADEGPPTYASDLKPDFGGEFAPPGGSL
jgi:hypothetical protein